MPKCVDTTRSLTHTDRYVLVRAKVFGDTPITEICGRVRKGGGRSGDGASLPEELKREVEQEWSSVVTAKLGFKNINEMREAWKKEHGY